MFHHCAYVWGVQFSPISSSSDQKPKVTSFCINLFKERYVARKALPSLCSEFSGQGNKNSEIPSYYELQIQRLMVSHIDFSEFTCNHLTLIL